jgi:septum formation protein
MLKLKKLVLASKSPRRQQLLKDAGFEFTIDTVDVEEHFSEDLKKAGSGALPFGNKS